MVRQAEEKIFCNEKERRTITKAEVGGGVEMKIKTFLRFVGWGIAILFICLAVFGVTIWTYEAQEFKDFCMNELGGQVPLNAGFGYCVYIRNGNSMSLSFDDYQKGIREGLR